MKKAGLFTLLCIILCLILSSCGIPKPPEENDIAQNIPDDIRTVIIENPFDRSNSDVYDMEVKSVMIDKRQTNEKEDIAYCIIELENDYYRFEKYIVMNYTYYDKGDWILDDYREYEPMVWQVKDCPFSVEEVATLLGDYNIVNINNPIVDTSSNTAEFTFDIKDIYENVTSEGTIDVTFQFDGSAWTYDISADNIDLEWNILGHWYSPIYGGLYLDINELNDEYVSVEIIYEHTAENALAGKKGTLIDVSDERFWHLKTQSTDMWEIFDENQEPYLQFRVYFDAWSDTWDIYIFKDSATAQVRMYPNTELYRVDSNPFIPD